MVPLVFVIFGICTIVNGNSIKELRTEKKIEKLFGKILSSDHIDELARRIAEKAVEKFNDLQNGGRVTNLSDQTPVLRTKTDSPGLLPIKMSDFDKTTAKVVTEQSSQKPGNSKVVESLSSFLIQSPNLPLKNLGFKYRKHSQPMEGKEEEVNYDAMVADDKTPSAENVKVSSYFKDSQETPKKRSSKDYSNEKIDARKSFERSEERKVVNLETFRGGDFSISKEKQINATVQEEDVYSGLERNSREIAETTTTDAKLTRQENNKLYAYQSSVEYADYHHKLDTKQTSDKERNY